MADYNNTGATGAFANTGTTTIGADTDVDGVGVVDLQTRNISRGCTFTLPHAAYAADAPSGTASSGS